MSIIIDLHRMKIVHLFIEQNSDPIIYKQTQELLSEYEEQGALRTISDQLLQSNLNKVKNNDTMNCNKFGEILLLTSTKFLFFKNDYLKKT
ncbi:unnamed protein product [Paramecium octaurelia]|uniref:Uncharacterized protein n=1 Tax=Paramecium octaurelia TaxID=43137 RepID=A0A8S1XMV5_PAROT|nr:unnamed protein product [Paramecium octaurelia]